MWAVAAADGEGSGGLHVVYTQPQAVAAFRKSGRFPDGTVLIKELFTTTTGPMTTGTVSWAADTEGWFVMVKDGAGRYAGNPLWGDGWGWAFFGAGDKRNTTTQNYKSECLGCHVPVQQTDWVHVQGYPVLER